MAESVEYNPPKSLVPFLMSQSYVSIQIGPVGSGKTTAAIFKIALQARRMAPCDDGVRRSRCCIVRNTKQMLKDSTIKDFLNWFPEGVAGEYKRSEDMFVLKFDNGDGTRTECECLFRGLDEKADVRRLLSTQLSFGYVDEVREIDPDIFQALQSRCGRYPNKAMVKPRPEWGKDKYGNPIGGCVTDDGKPNYMVWSATNPMPRDGWWGQYVMHPPKNASVFFQPSAMSAECDWRQHLPPTYYEDLVASHDEDWNDCYVYGNLSKSLTGTPVYKNFDAKVHVSPAPLAFNRSPLAKLIIGVDCALHPAAVFTQMTHDGRMMVLHEEFASGMGAVNFLREKVGPVLANKFNNHPCVLVVDPSSTSRASTDERSWIDIARALGYTVVTAPTNAIVARISAVDAYLTRMVNGKPGILIDPGCVNLIEGFADTYQYEAKKDGDTQEKPTKSHLNGVSDLHDGLQYAALYTDTTGVFKPQVPEALPVQRVSWAYV